MSLRDLVSSVAGRFAAQQRTDQFFLAVKISSTSVLATTWSVSSGQVVLGTVSYAPLPNDSFDSLLQSCDQVVSEALGSSTQAISQVIFAVPYHWIAEGKISASHLKELRTICKQLELQPLGYVSLTEALESYFKEVEGAPLTAILVGIEGKNSTLTVYRAGKQLGTHFLGLSDYSDDVLPQGIERALKKLNLGDVLPSRMILYDGKSDLTRASEKVTAYPWTARLPFLHFPKVETIPAEFVVKAVAVAGGMQQGGKFFTFEKDLDLKATDVEPIKKTRPAPAEPVPVPVPMEVPLEAPIVAESEVPEDHELPTPPEDMPEPAAELETDELMEVSPEEAGFVSDSNLNDVTVTTHARKSEPENVLGAAPSVANFTEFTPPAVAAATAGVKTAPLAGITTMFATLVGSVKNLLPKRSGEKKQQMNPAVGMMAGPGKRKLPLVVLLVIGLFILILAGGAFAYFVPKAHVFVTVQTQNFSHDLPVTVVTDRESTSSGNILVGSYVTTSEVGSQRAVATGKKLVGDKAKGTVTIYNSAGARTFPAGTVLTGNGHKFITGSEVSVASGSGSAAQTTVNVDVTAAEIGESSNVPAGVLFSVASLPTSSYQGKNDGPLTGGNSHQATVVTKDDQARLSASLAAELTNQAQTSLQAKLGPNDTLLPKAITSTVAKKKFTKDIDAEADTFGLDLTLDFKGVTFAKDDLTALFKANFSSDIPENYELASDSVQVSIADATTDKAGNVVLHVHVDAKIAPKVSADQVAVLVSGRNLQQASTEVTKLPGVTAVRVEVEPKFALPIVSFAMPWKKDNVSVDIVTE